jgi:peptidoglycan/xylan/chitin deacetylase (PgdA/CDA1 family)
MSPIIALRHDVDTTFGLRYGLQKIVDIEEEYNVKSTIFIRADTLKSEVDALFLRQLEKRGWEIGLHLINTINSPNVLSPEKELDILRDRLRVKVCGVTPCGSGIGNKGFTFSLPIRSFTQSVAPSGLGIKDSEDIRWRVLDSLGLNYMENYGLPPPWVKTFVLPTHLSFDIYYIRNFGVKRGYQRFRDDLTFTLKYNNIATVATHPEWFVRSVGMQFDNLWAYRASKFFLTLTRKRKMDRAYQRFLSDFKGMKFMKYSDLCTHLKSY